jgi:antitoxin ParD1/3/4
MDNTIALPESLKSWVDEQATLEGYATPAEYVQQILRKEQLAKNQRLRDQIDQKLLEGLDSGESIEVTPEFWEARRQKLKLLIERRKKADGV